ncbi:hypothetical protein [Caldicellulosiruptor naganoensis]|uniref:GCN5-related N-acetyltransferase n=1 Tax=Caldicellulosiruptor naganoensis TaxID=29324 RepID=A0ABY7BFQ7_9FIRM|nr:hypothetical protein [Caldicellulosiruptor naganoensis]WAM31653.1 hypothetical protein OTJ99_000084 [Caldicellulosiruptor naganoensis]
MPQSYKVEDLWESYLSGKSVVLHTGYSSRGAYALFNQFVRLETKYPDGSIKIRYVYSPIVVDPKKHPHGTVQETRALIQKFKKMYPNKVVIAIPERNNIICVKNEKVIYTTLVPDPKNKKKMIEKKQTVTRDAYYILF